MNQRFSAYLISIFASLISLGAFALEWKDVDGKGCRPGVYTYDYNAAIEYAKTHHRFILAFEGKLDGTCNNCKNTSAQTYGREDFRQWAAENNIPLVYGDYTPMTGYTRATYNWVVQFTNQQTFPQAAIIDEDGVTRLGAWEPIAPSGPNLSTRFYSKINPNFKGTQYFAFRNDPPVPDSVFNFLSACIELCDDTWQVARKLPATKEPFTWNMYYDLGTNTLRTAYISAGKKRYTDAVDWYVIADKPAAGMGFWLKAENVVDEKNYGKVLVFGSEADAQAEKNPLFAEISLKDFEQGLLVKNPGAKTYIKIYRTDDLPADEIVDVRYALTVQQKEASEQYFAFTQPDNQLWEDYSARGTEYPIAVIRKEAGKAETVTVCVSPNPDPGYDPAVWGKDFTLRGTNVTFAVDQLTNFVYVTTISNTTMTSVSPRVCKLTLTPATTPQTGYPTTYLTILDCEMRREAPQGDDIILCAREEGQTRVVTLQTAAYGDDVYDDYVNYYVLTNAPSSVGSIYVFSLQLNEFSNVPGDELKIGIYTNRDDCVRGEGALVTKTLLAKDVHEEPVRIEWGSRSATGYPPEVFLRVARAPQSQERKEWNPNLRLRYSLEWWRWDRPVASFADAETAFATALTDRTFRVEVPADYSQAMLEDLADAGKDPGFKVKWTAIPGPGSAEDWYELPDMDPVAVTTNAPGAIPVKLVPPQRFVRHDETLGFSLQPSDSPAVQDIYELGDQADFALTLRADVAKPAATEGAPFRCEVTAGGDGQTDWLVAADRNASYTNCEDWVEFVAQDTNEFFRIAVTNVTLLAAEADEIGVSVCRNDGTGGKAPVREFKLDELMDLATAPVLSFAGFTDRSVFVRIHRKVSEDVRLDYGLLFREWRPSKGDGGRLDEGDLADPPDDTREGAVVFTPDADGTNVIRTLHGFETVPGGNGRPYAVNDTNDWYRLTGLRSGGRYAFEFMHVDANVDVSVSFYRSGSDTALTNLAVSKGAWWFYDAADDGDLYARVSRGAACQVPAAVDYTLRVSAYVWPVFAFDGPKDVEVDCTTGAVSLTVLRKENANGGAVIRFEPTLSKWAENVILARSMATEILFADGSGVTNFTVGIREPVPDVWTGDWSCEFALVVDTSRYAYGTPSNVVLTVRDTHEPQLDAADAWDDVKSGATALAAGTTVTNRLNGIDARAGARTDTNDWFRVAGQARSHYRLRLGVVAASCTNGLEIAVAVVADGQTKTYTLAEAIEGIVVSRAEAGDFHVRIVRGTATEELPVSFKYELALDREDWPSFGVRFAATSATVDERATAVYVDVVCATESGEALEKDIVVTVNPTVDESVAHPAVPWTDFDPTPVSVSWLAGSTGGVRRVGIRLTNYDNVWEGDETFLLRLAKDEQIEAELTDPAEMCVTITDKDAPVYGTVGIVGYDGTAVREGGVFPVTLARVDGCSGVVTGKFSWTIGRTKVDRLVELFGDREDGEKTIELAVPETGVSSALSQAGTLAFALSVPAKTATVTKGTPTSIKLTVFTKDYGDELPAYSADDPTKVGFVTSASAWYLAADGSLGCLTPKAGAVALMNATVNGPGKLYVDATLVDAEKCELYALVSGVRTDLANGPDQAIDIPAGSRVVQIVFSRPKTTSAVSTKDTARAFVDNVRFVPGEGFRKTGTFTGAVSVKASGEAEATAGLGTLTVSALGRMSGKLQCANRTWTFDSDAGWDASGRAEPTARSGVAELPIILTVDGQTGVVTVGGEGVAGELVRNAWGDRPLAAAEIAAGEAFVGYYTLSLAGTADFGSGYLGITVNANGMVKATGMLADGQSVSLSGTLAPAAEGSATAFLYAAPSAYRGGWFALTVGFVRPADGPAYLVAAEGTGLPSWVRKGATGESLYARTPTPVGGAYGTVENLHDHYQGRLLKVGELDAVPELAVAGTSVAARFWAADAAHPVVLEFNESGTAVKAASDGDLFAMDFTRATGIFTGSIGANYLYQLGDVERETEVPIVCRGILTPCRENPDDGVEGRGYYLISGASQDVRIEQTED